MRLRLGLLLVGLAVIGFAAHCIIADSVPPDVLAYDAAFVKKLARNATEQGDVQRGAALFSSARLACLQCHQVGEKGGNIGPALTRIGTERSPEQIVESIFLAQT